MNAAEASAQNPAIEKRTQLALDEAGQRSGWILRDPVEEGLEFLGENAVENRSLRCAPLSYGWFGCRHVDRCREPGPGDGDTLEN